MSLSAIVLRRAAYLLAATSISVAAADSSIDAISQHQPYSLKILVSDGSMSADFTDPRLVNGWGVAFNPNGVVWVADNGTGKSTLYDGTGKPQSLVVSIPAAPGSGEPHGKPTGIVYNGSPDFIVSKNGVSGPGIFIFAGEDGGISAWAPNVDATHAVIVVNNAPAEAIYKGLALGGNGAGRLLYAADFHNRRVDVFDAKFKPVHRAGAFTDGAIPQSYGPFGIQNLNGDIYVTYAKRDADAEDDVAGPGLGFVDVYDADGRLIKRFAEHGALNAPWGLALAPRSFGPFGGALLVGNFGDGTINVYGTRSGNFLGTLRDDQGNRIKVDGLWGIGFGNGVNAQPTNALFFAAGPDDETHGAYGVIRVSP